MSDPQDKQGIIGSVIIHTLAVLVAIVLSLMTDLFEPNEPEHVFEMVAVAEPLPTPPLPPQQDDTPPPQLEQLDFAPANPIPLEPEIVEPTPPPAPEPEPKRELIPFTPKPEPKKPKPEPKPVVNYDPNKYASKPTPAPRPTPTVTKPVQTPSMDLNAIKELNISVPTANTQAMTKHTQDALQRYYDRIFGILKQKWNSDSLKHTIPRDSSVVVHIKISQSGSVISHEITKSSGYPQFDDSVVRAVKALPNLGTIPGNKAQTFAYTFTLRSL